MWQLDFNFRCGVITGPTTYPKFKKSLSCLSAKFKIDTIIYMSKPWETLIFKRGLPSFYTIDMYENGSER